MDTNPRIVLRSVKEYSDLRVARMLGDTSWFSGDGFPTTAERVVHFYASGAHREMEQTYVVKPKTDNN